MFCSLDVQFQVAKLHDAFWSGQLPVDVRKVAEACGVAVHLLVLPKGQLALISRELAGNYIVYVTLTEARVWQRIAIAHALGRVELGYLQPGETQAITAGDFTNESITSPYYKASQFALCLLMPPQTLRSQCDGGRCSAKDVANLCYVSVPIATQFSAFLFPPKN